MIVRDLLDQLKLALKHKMISLDDEVIIVGTGDRNST